MEGHHPRLMIVLVSLHMDAVSDNNAMTTTTTTTAAAAVAVAAAVARMTKTAAVTH